MRKKTLVYVIGAYSGDIKNNIMKAESVSIELIRRGYHVITPHKNTTGYESYENEKITYKTWIEMNLNILSRCDAVYVMDNAERSSGSKIEIDHAKKLGLKFITPIERTDYTGLEHMARKIRENKPEQFSINKLSKVLHCSNHTSSKVYWRILKHG